MKALKRIVSSILAATTAAVILASCGTSAPVSSAASDAEKIDPLGIPTATVAFENSRIHAFVINHVKSSNYVSADKTEVTAEGQNLKHIAAAFDSSHTYLNVIEDNVITITENTQDATTVYILNPADKTGMKMVSTPEDDEAGSGAFEILPDEQVKDFDCGTLTIDGQSLYFESRTSGEGEDRSTSYYCFDQNSTELRYYVSETDTLREVYKINELKAPADPALFVVSPDYKISDFSFATAAFF